jgi:hypothetical protein
VLYAFNTALSRHPHICFCIYLRNMYLFLIMWKRFLFHP